MGVGVLGNGFNFDNGDVFVKVLCGVGVTISNILFVGAKILGVGGCKFIFCGVRVGVFAGCISFSNLAYVPGFL